MDRDNDRMTSTQRGVGKLQLRLLITKVPKNLLGSSQVPQPHEMAMQIAVNPKARAGLKLEFTRIL